MQSIRMSGAGRAVRRCQVGARRPGLFSTTALIPAFAAFASGAMLFAPAQAQAEGLPVANTPKDASGTADLCLDQAADQCPTDSRADESATLAERNDFGLQTLRSSLLNGGPAPQFTFAGDTIIYADGETVNIAFSLFLPLTKFSVPTGTATQSGSIVAEGGTFAVEKIGAGTLIFSGNNTYTGTTTISAGTLIAASNSALGSSLAGTIVINGATLGIQGGVDISEAITLTGSGVGGAGALRNISGSNRLFSSIALGGAATIASDSGSLQVSSSIDTGGNLLTLTGAGIAAFVGVISGSGGITKTGSGQADLNGTNTYTGVTTVNSGILLLNGGSAIIDTGRVVVNGGAFGTFNDETIGSLEGTGGFVSVSTGSGTTRLTVGGNNLSTTYSGDLRDNGGGLFALGKIGTGTLTLASDNNFSGGTTISEGTLQIGNGGTTGTIGAGAVTNNASLVFNRSNNFTVANAISGTGSLTKRGAGNMTLSGANTYAGATTVEAGTLTVNSSGALGTAAGGTTVSSGATLAFSLGASIAENISFSGTGVGGVGALNALAQVNLAGNISLTGDGSVSVQNGQLIRFLGSSFSAIGNAALTVNTNGNSTIFLNAALSGIGGLVKNGTGQLELNGNNAFTGPITINGGVLQVSGGLAIPDGVSVTGAGSGTLSLTSSETIGSLGGTGNVFLFNNSILTTGANNASTLYAGRIFADGTGGLTKVGSGTFTLTGSNTYAGTTTISAGTLQIGDGGITGTLGTGAVTNNAALVFNRSNDFTVANAISGTGSLRKLGGGIATLTGNLSLGSVQIDAGTLALSGTNTFTGGITVAGGTLSLLSSGAAGGATGVIRTTGSVIDYAEGITVATPIILNSNTTQLQVLTGDATQSGVISEIGGARPLEKIGAGRLFLSGVNTFTGPLTITGGTLAASGGAAIADSVAVNIGALGGLALFGSETIGSLSGSGSVGFGGAFALTTGANNTSTTYSGQIFGLTGSLVKAGTGTFTLTGNNIYAGTTTINGGTLQVGDGGTTGTLGSGNIVNNAALVFNRSNDFAVSSAISGAGSLTKLGAGTLTLTGANTYGGLTTVTAGTLQIGNGGTAGSLGSGSVTNSGALVLNRSDDITIANTISGTGSLLKLGGGSATLTGALALGSIRVEAGTLTLTGLSLSPTVTTVAGGTLVYTRPGAGGIGGTTVQNGGSLILRSASSGNFTAGTLTLTGTGIGGAGVLRNQTPLTATSASAVWDGVVLAGDASIASEVGVLQLTNITGAGRTLTVQGDAATTIAGLSTGTGGLVKTGAGTLTLAGTNTYSGGTLIIAGRLQVGADANLGAATGGITIRSAVLATNASFTSARAISLMGASGIDVASGTILTLSGLISSAGNLDKTGDGQLVLTGNNAYAGFTRITGSGGLTVGSGGTTGSLGTGFVLINAGSFLAYNRSDAFTVANAITGAGALGKQGSGTLTLTGANTFTGGLSVSGGTIVLGNATAGVIDAAGTGTIQLFTGTSLRSSVSGTLGNTLSLAGANLTLATAAGTTLRLTGASFLGTPLGSTLNFGAATATGTIELAPTAVTLAEAAPGIAVNGGTLRLANANAFTFVSSGSGVTLNNATLGSDLSGALTRVLTVGATGGTVDVATGTLTLQSDLTGSGALIKTGAGELRLAGSANLAGSVQLNAGTLGIVAGSTGGWGLGRLEMATGTTLSVDIPLQVTYANNILLGAGAGSTILSRNTNLSGSLTGGTLNVGALVGSNFLVLSGNNSYGATNIAAGARVQVGIGGTTGTLGTGAVSLGAGSVLSFVRSDNQTVANILSGSGAIQKFGNNTLILTGSNTAADRYTGSATINAGTLLVNGIFGDVTSRTATVRALSGATLGGSGTIAGNVFINGGAILAAGNSPGTLSIAGNLILADTSILNFELGTPGVVGGANNDLVSVGGNLLLDGVLNVAALPGFGTGYYRLFNYGGTLTDNLLAIGTLPSGFNASIRTDIAGQVNVLLNNGAQIVQYWDGTDTAGALATVNGEGGAGSWTASATNWTTPTGFAVNSAWAGQVGVFAGAAGGVVTVTGTQAFQELRFLTNGYALSQVAPGNGGLATTGGFSIINVDTGISASVLTPFSGTGGITKTGTGTLNLGGINTFTGVTTVVAGTLANSGVIAGAVENSAALISTATLSAGLINNTGATASIGGTLNGAVTNSGTITLSGATTGIGAFTQTAGGQLSLAGNSTSIGSLAGAGTIALGAGNLTLGSANTSTDFAGVISGPGGLIKTGTGTLTLSGLNTYTGLTTIDQGSIFLATGALISGAVQNNATFTNSGRVAGLVTNAGTLISAGTLAAGLSNLAGASASLANTVNGTIANSGIVTLTTSLSGDPIFTQTASGRFDLAGFNASLASLAGSGTVLLGSGNLTVGSGNASTTFSGAISGSGALRKVGTAFLTLTGNNSYGATFIDEGTLDIGSGGTSGSLGTGPVTNNGLLNINRSDVVSLANAISGSGVLQNAGTGTLILSGTNSFTGGTRVFSGQIIAASNAALGASSGIVTVGAGGTLGLQGGITVANALAIGGEGLANVGALRNISGNNTVTGRIDWVVQSRINSDAGLLTLNGPLSGGSTPLIVGGAGDTRINGTISGNVSLFKDGAGTLTLAGANTFTGPATVSSGTLQILAGGSVASAIVNSGTLVSAGTIAGLVNNATGNASVSGQINGDVINQGNLTLTGTTTGIVNVAQNAGSFNLGGFNTTIASLAGSGGTLALGSATLTLSGTSFSSTTFDGTITGTGGLIKNGPSTFALSRAQTYTGATTINAGTLVVGAAGALAGTVQNNANFTNNGTIAGLVTNAGSLSSIGTLASGLTNAAAATATLRGAVNGILANSGTVSLSGTTTSITILSQAATGVTNLFGLNTTISTLTGSGSVNLGTAILTLGGSNDTSTFSGTIAGSGGLTKLGIGTLTLSGSNSASNNFTGTVNVNAGAVVIDGRFGDAVANRATLNIASGATLSGSGTFLGNVTVGAGGILAPGNSPGTLAIGGNLLLDAGSILNFELAQAGVVGGGINDLITVAGNLTLAGTLNVTTLPGFGPGIYRLFNYGGTLTNIGLAFGTMPADTIQNLITDVAGEVSIQFRAPVPITPDVLYWDGIETGTGPIVVNGLGGPGVWNATTTNWTAAPDFAFNYAWGGITAVFSGAAGGVVQVSGTQAFQQLRFETGGYTLTTATGGGGLATTGGTSIITVSTGLEARIDTVIGGTAGISKGGAGTLTFGGANTYSGLTTVGQGTLAIAASGSLASAVQNSATFTNAGTVAGLVQTLAGGTTTNTGTFGNGATNAGTLISSGTITGDLTNSGTATLSGRVNGAISNAATITLAGTLRASGTLTQTASGIFDMAGRGAVLGGLAGAGQVRLGAGILTVGDGTSTSFAGVISGMGTLTKVGTGTLTLTGANTFTGLTSVDGGGLTLAAGGALAGGVGNAATFTNAGTVAGLVQTFVGATTTNTGTFGNGATNAGTLISSGTITGDLTNSGTATLSGRVSGAISNAATITLAGTLRASGTLTQTASGIFDMAGRGAVLGGLAGAGQVRLGAGILTVGDGTSTSFAGVISGTGSLTKVGTGTLTLTGGNTFTGLTSIDGGGLTLAAGGALAGGVGNAATFTNAGTVAGLVQTFVGATTTNTGTFGNGATNAGTLISSDTINGELSNTGRAVLAGRINGTFINAATASLSGALTVTGAFTQNAGGTISLGNFAATIGSLAGAGALQLQTGSLTVGSSNASTLFSGVISGTGSLTKVGTGTLTLTGTNTYTGLTVIDGGTLVIGQAAGGTAPAAASAPVAIGSGGAIAAAETPAFAPVRDSLPGGAILVSGTTVPDSPLSAAPAMAGLGAGDPAAAGDVLPSGERLALIGRPSGGPAVVDALAPGALASASGTTEFLTPAGAPEPHTDLGLTRDLGNGAAFVQFDRSIAAPDEAPSGEPVSAPAFAAVADTGGSAVVTAVAPTAFAETTPPSTAVIAGSILNNATLINNGTVLGQLVNSAGAIATNNGVIRGAVTNRGTLTSVGTLGGGLDNSGTARISGIVTGPVINSGSIMLTGTTTGITTLEQATTGVFDLAGFDTTIGSLSGAGSMVLGNARLTTGIDGVNTLFSGVISGNGALTKVGNGALILTGANTYAGGTTISGGILQIGNGGTTGSIVGPVLNNGTFIINRSDAVTFAGAISGSGVFVQGGTGTTTLTGASTYRGGTLISRGRLVGTTTSLQGLIQNDAALEFAQNTNGVFAAAIFGTGLLDKTGAGLLELTGDGSGLRGATTVRAGELRVTGSLASSVTTVLSSASLSGNGVIGGLVARSGSTIAPGANGLGVLGVNGAVDLQTGSTLQLQVQAIQGVDAIISNGAVQLGGTAAFSNLGGVFAFNSRYVLLQTSGTRTGTFDAVTGFADFGILYRPELVYTANQVVLRMAPNQLANIVGGASLTPNQRAVISVIDTAVAAGYNPQPLFNVYSLAAAQQVSAFDQLSGEAYATAAGVGIEQERLVREAVLGRVAAVAAAARTAPEAGSGPGAWGQVLRTWGDGASDGNAARYDIDREGFITGIDYGSANAERSWRAGAYGFHLTNRVNVAARGSRVGIDQTGGGVYAAGNFGGFGIALGASLAGVDLTSVRQIALTGFAETNRGFADGRAIQTFAEVSYTFQTGKATLRPFLGGAAGWFRLDALTESGGAAALTVQRQRYDAKTLMAGADGAVSLGKVRLAGSLAGRLQIGDRDPVALIALAAAPGQAFAVEGIQLDRLALAARFDATVALSRKADLSLGYTGLIGKDTSDHGARATISIRF